MQERQRSERSADDNSVVSEGFPYTPSDRRPPTPLGHHPSLDGLRGLAICLVLLGHLGDLGMYSVKQAGATGVTVFFVLSGFLITKLLCEEHYRNGSVAYRRFYARRALRLLPAIAAMLAVVGSFAAVTGSVSAPVGPPALYLANVVAATGQDLGVLVHTWSLSMEEQFYVVWPVALGLVLRRSRRAAWVLACAGASLSIGATVLTAALAIDTELPRIIFGPDLRAYGLLVGSTVALSSAPSLPPGRLAQLGAASVAVLFGGVFVPAGRPFASYAMLQPLVALASAIVVIALVQRGSLVARIASSPVPVWLGRISYGLYLWHLPVFFVLWPHLRGTPFVVRAGTVVTVSLLVAISSHRFVEAPFLRLKSRFAAA